MREFTPQHKHSILTHYRAGVRGAGFDALARRFAVAGGGSLIRSWYAAWDGTPASLQQKGGAGRPHILSRAEVSRHVMCVHRCSPPTARIDRCTTRHCCHRSRRKQARSCPFALCSALARISRERSRNAERREQLARVSQQRHTRGSQHACLWSA